MADVRRLAIRWLRFYCRVPHITAITHKAEKQSMKYESLDIAYGRFMEQWNALSVLLYTYAIVCVDYNPV